MPSKAIYQSFKDLAKAEIEDVDFCVRYHQGISEIAILAIHGGGIEPGTTEIAEATAGDRHSFYSFCGLKKSGNFILHITSKRFDEPQGVAIAGRANTIISIHGCGDSDSMILAGGRNVMLKDKIQKSLEKAGFQVKQSIRFPGLSPLNICNRCRSGAGVQLEICHGLRNRMFKKSLLRSDRDKTTEVFHRFVDTLKTAIEDDLI
jgi:phage replication-related protein YjqB (UPF0714/DUF867 family)